MPIQGITITERVQPSVNLTTVAVNRICLTGFATAADSANVNQIIGIASLSDFQAKFTGASDRLVASVRAIFRNFAEARVSFIAAKDPAIATAGDKGHLVYAIKEIGKKNDLELHILCIPEFGDIAIQNDRTTVYAEAEAMALKSGWLHFFNTPTATATANAAITEAALYSSPFGNSAIYYGMFVDLEDKQIPLSVIACAIALQRFRDNPFNPPAGVRYPIKGIKSEIAPVALTADFESMKNKGINCAQDIPSYGKCVWGARTLAKEQRFTNVNTRVAMSVVNRQLLLSLLPQLFESSDPQGYTRGEVIRLVTSLLEQAYTNGAISGATSQDAYRIVEQDVTASTPAAVTGSTDATPAPTVPVVTAQPRNLRRIRISAYVRFVETLELIEVEIINVDLVPAGNV